MKVCSRLSRPIAAALVVSGLQGAGVAAAQTPPWVAVHDGDLDSRFGSNGIVTTSGSAAIIQPDGKLVVSGAVVLTRHNVDGSLDHTFGDHGTVQTIGGRALRRQPDGRLVALAGANLLVRYNSDGSLDDSFGNAGQVTTPWSAAGFALDQQGRIVLVGTLIGRTSDVVVARYNGDGSPDSSFGTGGSTRVDKGRDESATAVAIQPDGKVLVAGRGFGPTSFRDDFMVLRQNDDGSNDPDFGRDGVVYTDFGGRIDGAAALLVQPDGKIVVAGSAGSNRINTPFDFGLARYLENGAVDGTFGGGGLVTTIIGSPADTTRAVGIALEGNGAIVAVGAASQFAFPGSPVFAGIAIVRYRSNGTTDDSFGVGGIVTTDVGGGFESASGVLVQPDGQVVVTGLAEASPACSCGSVPVLARYRNDSARGAFGWTAVPVPGRIEAEDYDLGGQGTGYFDTTAGNEQGFFVYRTDEVDIKVSNEGGHTIGWLASGEWLDYTINVQQDGLYTIQARVGSAFPDRTFHVEIDGRDITGPIAVPQLPDWDQYETVNITGIPLTAGVQVLRVVMGPEDFMDFQWLAVVSSPSEPFGGVPWAIPGRIEAEDYDVGGQDRAYYDTTPGNEQGFPVYRADDVDIKESAEAGYTIGWLAAGEWLAYTMNVQSDGIYTIHARVGSAFADRTFHVEVDGIDMTGSVAVPQLADWDQYETVSVAGVALHAGTQRLTIVMGPADFMDLQWIEIVP